MAVVLWGTFFSGAPDTPQAPHGYCDPNAQVFHGYTFMMPDIVNKNVAYAPYFLKWDDYYQEYYFNKDLQKEGNVQEWIERFCSEPEAADVEYVVYEASLSELAAIHAQAAEKARHPRLPSSIVENTFAIMLSFNGCTDVTGYLQYAKRCEPHTVPTGDGWTPNDRNVAAMLDLIEEGLGRFKETEAPFLKMRYAYQIVRLAHYARMWDYTVEVYNYLLPKIDRRKPSILYYWTLGHLAGALRQLGRYPEAAYRYSLIFRDCASKRKQAWRSFLIRDDNDWKATLQLCQSDQERATLYLMRASKAEGYGLEDIRQVYEFSPTDPQLELLLVSAVQRFERIFLRTRATDKKYGVQKGLAQRTEVAPHLLEFKKFIGTIIQDGQAANIKLCQALEGYLDLLAGDHYAAEKAFERSEKMLKGGSDYDEKLYSQLEIWRTLLEILKLDVNNRYVEDAIQRIRGYEAFQTHAHFEPFLQDWVGAAYAANDQAGRAFLTSYDAKAMLYNPRLDVLEDLLKLSETGNPEILNRTMRFDTNPELVKARLLEIKAVRLLSTGQPEAALVTLRAIPPTAILDLPKFSPFKEQFSERVHGPVVDSLILNRRQIVERLIDYEFKAKAAEAVNDPIAEWYYYMIGIAWYNMSYFGYEWETTDFYRSGYNWLRLAQGPVFPLKGAPDGNRENTDLSLPLSYFERVINGTRSAELAARATFMAARCQQKQWFALPGNRYQPGSQLIPVLPETHYKYYDRLIKNYAQTEFYKLQVQECKWLAAYAR